MQQQMNQPEQAQPQIQLDIDMNNWFEVVTTLRENLNVETLLAILNDPDARSQYAYVWVSIVQLLYGIVIGVTTSSEISSVIFLALFFAISGTASYVVQNWLVQRFAVAYDGNPDGYRMLHYGRAIYYPITTGLLAVVILLSTVVPALQFLASWMIVADVLLMVVVLQHINNFSYFKASLMTLVAYFGSFMLLQIILGGAVG